MPSGTGSKGRAVQGRSSSAETAFETMAGGLVLGVVTGVMAETVDTASAAIVDREGAKRPPEEHGSTPDAPTETDTTAAPSNATAHAGNTQMVAHSAPEMTIQIPGHQFQAVHTGADLSLGAQLDWRLENGVQLEGQAYASVGMVAEGGDGSTTALASTAPTLSAGFQGAGAEGAGLPGDAALQRVAEDITGALRTIFDVVREGGDSSEATGLISQQIAQTALQIVEGFAQAPASVTSSLGEVAQGANDIASTALGSLTETVSTISSSADSVAASLDDAVNSISSAATQIVTHAELPASILGAHGDMASDDMFKPATGPLTQALSTVSDIAVDYAPSPGVGDLSDIAFSVPSTQTIDIGFLGQSYLSETMHDGAFSILGLH